MRTAYLLPEMVQAGAETVIECSQRRIGATEVAVAVYLAMEAIREIAELKRENETIH